MGLLLILSVQVSDQGRTHHIFIHINMLSAFLFVGHVGNLPLSQSHTRSSDPPTIILISDRIYLPSSSETTYEEPPKRGYHSKRRSQKSPIHLILTRAPLLNPVRKQPMANVTLQVHGQGILDLR